MGIIKHASRNAGNRNRKLKRLVPSATIIHGPTVGEFTDKYISANTFICHQFVALWTNRLPQIGIPQIIPIVAMPRIVFVVQYAAVVKRKAHGCKHAHQTQILWAIKHLWDTKAFKTIHDGFA